MKQETHIEYGAGINGEQYDTVTNYDYTEEEINEMKAEARNLSCLCNNRGYGNLLHYSDRNKKNCMCGAKVFPKFKIGDRIICIKQPSRQHWAKVGAVATIRDLDVLFFGGYSYKTTVGSGINYTHQDDWQLIPEMKRYKRGIVNIPSGYDEDMKTKYKRVTKNLYKIDDTVVTRLEDSIFICEYQSETKDWRLRYR